VLVALAALVVALVRKPLFDAHGRVAETTDVYALPPPQELRLLSLGYRSALADLLWAHVMVSQGLHSLQRRRFENLVPLLDAINELEPTYREPYLFAESLITFQSAQTPVEEVRMARAILERGTRNRPLDGEIWLALGEFVAFIAPGSYLTDPAEQAQWRVDGARMLARAAEVGGDSASWQTIGAAGIFSQAGERAAAIRFLRRGLAVAEDPELKASMQAHLQKLLGGQRDELFLRLDSGIFEVRHNDLPPVGRSLYMLLGPPRDAAYCAGSAHADEAACAATWSQWQDRTEEARNGSVP
jgi:hypothetical protein